jgi:site-specific DNA recombinase
VRAIGYIRVSSEKQAQEGVRLDAQRIRIQAHCVAMDIELMDIVVDDVTAKSLDRQRCKLRSNV